MWTIPRDSLHLMVSHLNNCLLIVLVISNKHLGFMLHLTLLNWCLLYYFSVMCVMSMLFCNFASMHILSVFTSACGKSACDGLYSTWSFLFTTCSVIMVFFSMLKVQSRVMTLLFQQKRTVQFTYLILLLLWKLVLNGTFYRLFCRYVYKSAVFLRNYSGNHSG